MRLTTRTTLALRTLMVCAADPERLVRKHDVAAAIGASENHLAHVVNRLAQTGYIVTRRGRNGGFRLARPAAAIGVGAVCRAFEGALPFLDCEAPDGNCPLSGRCRMAPHMQRALAAFYAALDDLTLDALIDCDAGLDALLHRPAGAANDGCAVSPPRR